MHCSLKVYLGQKRNKEIMSAKVFKYIKYKYYKINSFVYDIINKLKSALNIYISFMGVYR